LRNQRISISKMKKFKDKDGSGISTPYDVKQVAHVTDGLDWNVSNPEDLFTIKAQLGKGAYGAVFKAEFKTGHPIAAKKIYDEEAAKITIKKEVEILKICTQHVHQEESSLEDYHLGG